MNARTTIRLCLPVIALVVCANGFPAAAPAADPGRPDLSVQQVSNVPRSLSPGDRFKVALIVRNGGARARSSKLNMYLSSDARRGAGDIRLSGTPSVRALRRGETARVSAAVTVPASAAGSRVRQAPATPRYRVLACADGSGRVREKNERNNCRASNRALELARSEPTSLAPSTPPTASGNEAAGPSPAADLAPPPPAPATGSVTGRVVYSKRDCISGPAWEAPLANATVRLVSATGQTVNAPLDADGRFDAQVAGDRPIRATAITDGPRVSVTPPTDPPRPYEIALGEVTQVNQTFLIGQGAGHTQVEPASGAANIYAVLDRGAQVAAGASPVPLPKVNARWRYAGDLTGWLGDRTPSQYDDRLGDTLHVGGTLHGRFRDEWEAWPLLHEYAHHVMWWVANPPGAVGSHTFDEVFQGNPALPWSEGFSHAFAAIALRDPGLTLGCSVRMDLSAKPAAARFNGTDPLKAMPPAGDEHLAQYNETAIAGSVWGVTAVLGANRGAGLGRLLRAMKSFNDKYHAPRDMREVRDALTEFEDGQSGALQQEIGNAFDDHRLRWGFHLEELSQVEHGEVSGWVLPWARGSFCNMPSSGQISPITRMGDEFFAGPVGKDGNGVLNHYGGYQLPEGPLAHTRHDECWEMIRGAWLDGDASVDYSLVQTMPYQPNQAHRAGSTVIGLVFECPRGIDGCAGSSRTITLRVGTGVWHRPNGQTYLDTVQPLNAKPVTVTLPAVWRATAANIVPVAEIDALGRCRTLVGPPQDCGN